MAAPLIQVYPNSKFFIPKLRFHLYQCATYCSQNYRSGPKRKDPRKDKDGFRVLENVKVPPVDRMFLDGGKPDFKLSKFIYYSNIKPPRFTKMPVDQDWTNVWPSAHTFKWSAVPLPLRQGQIKSKQEAAGDGLAPGGFGNLELMKIPNFLHLTPDHIRKHCVALKKFTTPWPKELDDTSDLKRAVFGETSETDEQSKGRQKYSRKKTLLSMMFPLEIVTSDYCFAGPSIRDERARFVRIKFHINALKLDEHAKDKFIKLVGRRYKPKTGMVVMRMGRCPLRAQNYEYLIYQLTALYFESMNKESWEELMTEDDMRYTPWGSENSKQLLEKLLSKDPDHMETEADADIQGLIEKKTQDLKEDLVKRTEAKPLTEKVYYYKVASEKVLTGRSTDRNIKQYKTAVLKLLNMKKQTEPQELGQQRDIESS